MYAGNCLNISETDKICVKSLRIVGNASNIFEMT